MNHASNMATCMGVEVLDRAVICIIGPYAGPVKMKLFSKCQVHG